MKMNLLIGILAFTFSIQSWAHEGHDTTPGQLKAMNGGVMKAGKQLNLEVVQQGQQIKIFPVAHTGSTLRPNEVTLVATAKPRKGKAYPVDFKLENDHFVASIDLKGANRVPVLLEAKVGGKIDKFTIQVEQ